jgi:hypothetical protein
MLHKLIEAHQKAQREYAQAADIVERAVAAYEADAASQIKVILYDEEYSVSEGRERLLSIVDGILSNVIREAMPFAIDMSPEFADQFGEFMRRSGAILRARIDAALDAEALAKERFGVTSAETRWKAAHEAERQAIDAVCSYRCVDHNEERDRLRYLIEDRDIISTFAEYAPSLSLAIGDQV